MAKTRQIPTVLEDLVPAPYNPRSIDADSARGLRASLKRYGDLGGIVWNATTGHLVLRMRFGWLLTCSTSLAYH